MSTNNSITPQSINAQAQILSQNLSRSLGFILLICGTIGDCFNILVFLTVGHYKQNSCSQYMLVGSFFDLLFLLIGLITRTFSQGFGMDFTLTNAVWCKMRSSLLDILSFSSFTCVCLQSMDVYFITSRSAVMRQRSNIKTARYLLIGFVLFWIAHEIPSFVFQNLIFTNGSPSCTNTNAIYTSYHTYGATLVLSICGPITVISFFAYHIYLHLHSMTAGDQHILTTVGRQMTKMSLYRISMFLLFQFPFGVATAYFTATTNLVKSPERQLQDKLTQAFFNIYVYGIYSVRNKGDEDAFLMISFSAIMYE